MFSFSGYDLLFSFTTPSNFLHLCSFWRFVKLPLLSKEGKLHGYIGTLSCVAVLLLRSIAIPNLTT